jgi:uroporphyrin-III C-methyltransferase/precorrin-2 dehydrogenase/sirohydrochlorin ferrochelatase
MSLFPAFLKLDGRRVLLVGGGRVASAKLKPLLETGARVAVVAPEITEEILAAPVDLQRRPFQENDLDGVWFAVAAATPEANQQVAAAAEARRVFVNAVDDPRRASAYTGGVLRKGGITVAVSTEGAAPALAGLLREGLEAVIPDDVAEWIEEARRLRATQRSRGVPMSERRPQLLDALNRLYAKDGAA